MVAAYPVELAEGSDATKAVYSAVLTRAGVRAPFEGRVPAAVLVRPVRFADSVLYLLVSESAADAVLDLKDAASGGRVRAHLPAGHAKLVLLDRKSGAVLAQSD